MNRLITLLLTGTVCVALVGPVSAATQPRSLYVPGYEALLHQNVPNPFNPSTVISYELANTETVTLGIYDVHGRLIRTLVSRAQNAGEYKIRWDGRDDRGSAVASGVYFYRLAAGSFVETRRMVLLK